MAQTIIVNGVIYEETESQNIVVSGAVFEETQAAGGGFQAAWAATANQIIQDVER